MTRGNRQYDLGIAVKLIYAGHSLHPSIISGALETTPDAQHINGEHYVDANGIKRISSANLWELSRLEVTEDDIEFGVFEQWGEYLVEKSGALARLDDLGCHGYMDFHLTTDNGQIPCIYIDASMTEILGICRLGLNVWSTLIPKVVENSV